MIISIDWLKEFVNIEENPNELADLLSIIGLESELGSFPTEIHQRQKYAKPLVFFEGDRRFPCVVPCIVFHVYPFGYFLQYLKIFKIQS